MGNVVRFQAQGREYPLSLVEREDGRWVGLQQVSEALGNQQPRRLLHELKQSGEMIDEIDCRYITERQVGDTQARTRVELSRRGVLIFAMRSQGQRAREFRRWAVDVLAEVMATGRYGPIHESLPTQIEDARIEGFHKGFGLFEICARHNLPMPILAKACRFRTMGLTQKETALICGFSRDTLRNIEAELREIGITFKPVIANQRDKRFMADLPAILAGGGAL